MRFQTPQALRDGTIVRRGRGLLSQQDEDIDVVDDLLRREGEGRGNGGNIPRIESSERRLDVHSVENQGQLASTIVSTYNLTSTILGAGILSIPYALAQSGIVCGLLLLGFTAVASTFSSNLILSSYLRTGRASYGDLALVLFGPKMASAVRWMIIILNTGAAAGYMLVIKSLVAPSICALWPTFCPDPVVTTACVVYLIVFPLSCLKDLSSLRVTSMLAFFFAIFLTCAIMTRSIQHGRACFNYGPKNGIMGIFRGLPVFCFCFICHINVVPVYKQLKERSPSRMRIVFRNAIFFSLVLYVLCGSFGFARFSCEGNIPDNILSFGSGKFRDNDPLIAAARFAEALTCTLALPLIQHPTRVALHSLLFPSAKEVDIDLDEDDERDIDNEHGPRLGNGDVLERVTELDDESVNAAEVPLLPPTVALSHNAAKRRTIRVCESFLIISIAFGAAMLVPNVSTVFGLLGSTGCAMVCFILPGLFYIKATQDIVKFIRSRDSDRGILQDQQQAINRMLLQRRFAFALTIFGSLVGIIGTAAVIKDL